MKCPTCKKEVSVVDPFLPFCSERCKLIDLGNWASEKYVIPGSPAGRVPGGQPEEEPDDAEG